VGRTGGNSNWWNPEVCGSYFAFYYQAADPSWRTEASMAATRKMSDATTFFHLETILMSILTTTQIQAEAQTIPQYKPYGWEQWPENVWLSYQFRRTLGYAQLGGAR
jgi:hypothetical protein